MVRNPKFMELVIEREILTKEEARKLNEAYRGDAFAILLLLMQKGLADRITLGRLWGDSLGVSFVEPAKSLLEHELVVKLPEKFARANHIILLYKFGDLITAATSNPTDRVMLQEASKMVGVTISPTFAFPGDIEDAIEIEYQTDDALKDLANKLISDTILVRDLSELTQDQLQKIAGNQAVAEFALSLMLLAIRERASDIHIEPHETFINIRFRIDGVLQDRTKLERPLHPPLVSRLKILADLDITERRRPLDGRITLKLKNRSFDFRFSSIPTIYGEKVVLRVLGQIQTREVTELTELALAMDNYEKLIKIIHTPNGIFFVTGPTGSGKTTTLFSVLRTLNKPGVNITTVEDPVEYRLPGISQVQTNEAADLHFATAMRAFLRQDPDIILVGEIRDLETARIACQAALTGHLVLSTLHTNNAIQAVTRLMDIGVEPYLVAPSIIGVMAQRLVRCICPQCKESYRLSQEEVDELFVAVGNNREVFFQRGKGCTTCSRTGYLGRMAIHEVLNVDEDIRRMVTKDTPLGEIFRVAVKSGFRTMHYDGIKKVLRGLTTLEEVNRVTAQE